MRNYEVTFIVDPVLSGDEIKSTAQKYVDMVTDAGAKIIHRDDMGIRQLAYPIKTRSSGVYTCVEFECEKADWLTTFELAMRRDERILRFLTVKLDKFGVKYNSDKREGKIGKVKKVVKEEPADDRRGGRGNRGRNDSRSRRPQSDKPAPTKEAPVAKKEAPAPEVKPETAAPATAPDVKEGGE